MVLPKYLYFLPFFFSTSAFILAFVGTSCEFVQFTSIEPVNTNPISGETSMEPLTLHFGYWYHQSWNVTSTSEAEDGTIIEGGCDFYPSTVDIDKNWKAARTFNLIAIILGGSIILLDIFQGCLSTQRDRSCRTGLFGYSVCCLCSGLSLILLDSNLCKHNILIEQLNQLGVFQFQETCSISKGGKASIAATVLWFVAAIGVAMLHPFPKKKQEQNGHDEGLDEPLFIDDDSNNIT